MDIKIFLSLTVVCYYKSKNSQVIPNFNKKVFIDYDSISFTGKVLPIVLSNITWTYRYNGHM